MQLRAYLDTHAIPISVFADRLGVSVQAIHRYINGERTPKPAVMARIASATCGKVQPNDFFEPAEAA
jgi:transcriptional regulator with XRE-family HTH domain